MNMGLSLHRLQLPILHSSVRSHRVWSFSSTRPMKTSLLASIGVLSFALVLCTAPHAAAHCDTLDGPVVEAAKLALEKGDVTPVIKWVNQDGEKEVREAFAAALKVRKLGEDARKLADQHFFETLVRVHRAGEGVGFTGLKPAGSIDPAFAAADKALRDGDLAELMAEATKALQEGLRSRFAEVIEKKKHADDSVEAGRAFVAAYVDYAHYVEAIHGITSRDPKEHHHIHASESQGE